MYKYNNYNDVFVTFNVSKIRFICNKIWMYDGKDKRIRH